MAFWYFTQCHIGEVALCTSCQLGIIFVIIPEACREVQGPLQALWPIKYDQFSPNLVILVMSKFIEPCPWGTRSASTNHWSFRFNWHVVLQNSIGNLLYYSCRRHVERDATTGRDEEKHDRSHWRNSGALCDENVRKSWQKDGSIKKTDGHHYRGTHRAPTAPEDSTGHRTRKGNNERTRERCGEGQDKIEMGDEERLWRDVHTTDIQGARTWVSGEHIMNERIEWNGIE